MKKFLPVRQGLLTGLISAVSAQTVFTVVNYFNQRFAWDILPGTIRGLTGLLTMVILGVGIYIGMEKSREKNDGIISWKQAFLCGLVISLITAVIAAIGAWLYGQFIEPDFSQAIVSQTTAIMTKRGNNETEIQQVASEMKTQMAPRMLVIQALTGQLVGGIILSTIIALFIKRSSITK